MTHFFGLALWLRLLIFAIGLLAGFYVLLRPLQIGNIIGQMPWAEQKLGPGGTYSAIKLFGIGIIIVSVIVLVNF